MPAFFLLVFYFILFCLFAPVNLIRGHANSVTTVEIEDSITGLVDRLAVLLDMQVLQVCIMHSSFFFLRGIITGLDRTSYCAL